MAKKRKNTTLQENLTAVRGMKRERFFAEGGTQVMYHGGIAHTIPNKKREANRRACRKFSID